jgi:uncharacterized protein with von Willebrand factor type A (vWA) domain
MKFQYGEYDGNPFPPPDALFPEPRVVKFILQYGQEALDAMEKLDDDEEQQYIQALIEAGLLEEVKDEQGNRHLQLTPKMLKGIQHKALLEIFEGMQRGEKEGHATTAPGRTMERGDGSKPYVFGDSLSELDLSATMRNAVARRSAERREGKADGPALPLGVHPNDFELHVMEGSTDCATVMLLDLSGSMMRYGRFYQAKRVALGMAALVESRFPQDTLDYVGFYTLADRLHEKDVPLVMPKPVTVHDYSVRIRMALEEARANPQSVPQHFTNLQLGLRAARQMLSRRGAANKQIFIITDGQPTAHVEAGAAPGAGAGSPGAGGQEMLYLLYPPNEKTTTATLKEALRCHQQGIRIASFALIEDYWGMDWVGFIDQLTRLTRGIAYYCTSENLSSTVIESYLSGKKKKKFVG